MKRLLMLSLVALSLEGQSADLPRLVGDGVADDTDAIQSRIDSGMPCVYLPPPKVRYVISRTLEIGSRQEIRLDRFSEVVLKAGSNCHMLRNRNRTEGDRHVAIVGGIWNFDNANQFPNPWLVDLVGDPRFAPKATTKDLPPRDRWPVLSRGGAEGYDGMCMRFDNVRDFVMRDVVIRNPATFGFCGSRISYFVIDGVEFDYDHCNPFRANMDGIHLDGGSHHGRISNLRGACFDDLLALNANDGGHSRGEGLPITDIDVDGIYSEDCHSAVRLLSTGAPIRRISVRNVHGTFYRYAIGFTHFMRERETRGVFDAISISDCGVSKARHPADLHYDMPRMPLIFFDERIDVGSVAISTLCRDERESSVEPTIAVYRGCRIADLSVDDCQQVNGTPDRMTFLRVNGEIGKLTLGNVRMVPSPGENELRSDVPMAGEPPR